MDTVNGLVKTITRPEAQTLLSCTWWRQILSNHHPNLEDFWWKPSIPFLRIPLLAKTTFSSFFIFFLPKDTDKVCHLYLINIFSVRGLKKKKEEEKNYIASQANPSNYCSSTCSAANGPHWMPNTKGKALGKDLVYASDLYLPAQSTSLGEKTAGWTRSMWRTTTPTSTLTASSMMGCSH